MNIILKINKTKLIHNAKQIQKIAMKKNVKISFVLKAFCANKKLLTLFEEFDSICDSRIQNLKKAKNKEKILLRVHENFKQVIKYSNISLNSELKTIKKLNLEAKKQNVVHKIILMIDLGDLREGIFYEKELFDTVYQVLKLKNIKLEGIGTNLTCFGAILPSVKNLSKLCNFSEKIEKHFNIKLNTISGGNSSSLHLLLKDRLPRKINHLRIGEAILTSYETAYNKKIKSLYDGVFYLYANIIELKYKPSKPIGKSGLNAFGQKVSFCDNGILKRAILDIGALDIDINSLYPIDKNIKILGQSSDHLILDLTNCTKDYKLHQKIKFSLGYSSLIKVFLSKYIKKKIV